MRTGLTKQEKTTDIWFDEKDPLIHIRTHNTDLKKRLAAYAGQYPDQCCQTDADPETGCMEFEIRKGRFSFRLTAPYSEERRRAASEAAKAHTDNLWQTLPYFISSSRMPCSERSKNNSMIFSSSIITPPPFRLHLYTTVSAANTTSNPKLFQKNYSTSF